ncbi:penicillin-binding protein activator [Candidatus Gullanella endobia]|uniref:penicillin-binding protein activator n=1 Tax=Candidatus Gullanella endobia TaxID=1070130 RepID=UPI0009ED29E1|nr:penicillin-binding protein activator [Candidatus Gullanella endobia]
MDKAWKILVSLSFPRSNLAINANENILRGWLDLLNAYHKNRKDPTLLQTAIKDWQILYPKNPMVKMLPTPLSQVKKYFPSLVRRVALLLPIHGQEKIFSYAIQKGFSAAINNLVAKIC